MKNLRKILAVLLCFATLMTVCIPFASADEPSEETTQITQETPETETPEETDKEDTYLECFVHCLKGGLQNLSNAGLFAVGTLLCPIVFFVFPPGAVTIGIVGLPASAVSLFVGIGEIIASPILAFFFDTNDYMGVFNRKENNRGYASAGISADVLTCSD